jgi:hypothetical protein
LAASRSRGALTLPVMPSTQALALPGTPRRTRPHSTADGTMPDSVAQAIVERIKADDPTGARVLLDGVDAMPMRVPNGARRLGGASTSRTTMPMPG